MKTPNGKRKFINEIESNFFSLKLFVFLIEGEYKCIPCLISAFSMSIKFSSNEFAMLF